MLFGPPILHPGRGAERPTTVVTTDSVGNVLSSQDAEGQVTDTMYNDVGGNDFDELCWSARPLRLGSGQRHVQHSAGREHALHL